MPEETKCPKMKADPFEREKAIREGKLDNERPSFGEITGWLGRVPKTWVPSILIRVVQIAEAQNVFQDGGLERTVSKVVADCKKPLGLRDFVSSLEKAESLTRAENGDL